MKFKQILLYSSFFIFYSSFLFAQEHYDHLAPLKMNPVLVNYVKQAKKSHKFVWRLISDSTVLSLPFVDDFSYAGPYPNPAKWLDNAAFINNTYPICPPTWGVATLDGVNSEGQPYNPSCPPGSSYPADSLTSRPINMAQYNASENVWLSFYWQAGGRGMAPLPSDTLLLQFRTSKTPWTTIWYQLGYTPVSPDTGFHLVMIPLLDTIHEALDSTGRFNPFDGNFQFRFKNYACTSANADQWNIDFVYLADRWTPSDTAAANTSFVYESPSLLADYEYMPWEQFTQNDLKDNMYLQMRNNGSLAPVTYNYSINTTPISTLPQGVTDNMNPFYNSGYDTNYAQTHPAIKSNFNYTPLTGPDTLTITHYILNTNELKPSDDTLKFKQIFSDYYAYDDGTAEASYFINGTAPLDLAEEFTLNNTDTLRGLELYFNYMFVNPANYNMILAVWDNSGPGGSPGKLLFQNNDTDVTAPRTSDTLNGFTFYPYISSSPIVITGGTTIYVGWIQTNGDSLNIGFDYNTNSTSKIWYNVNTYPGGWQACSYQGSVMMRPVFGKSNFPHSPIGHQPSKGDNSLYQSLSIYPNPASDMINLGASMPPNTTLKIYTADGREYLNNSNFYGNSVNTSSLPAGFYIIEVTPQGGNTYYQKLLIQR